MLGGHFCDVMLGLMTEPLRFYLFHIKNKLASFLVQIWGCLRSRHGHQVWTKPRFREILHQCSGAQGKASFLKKPLLNMEESRGAAEDENILQAWLWRGHGRRGAQVNSNQQPSALNPFRSNQRWTSQQSCASPHVCHILYEREEKGRIVDNWPWRCQLNNVLKWKERIFTFVFYFWIVVVAV